MDAAQWKRVDDLLQSALALPPDQREPFLRESCEGDEELEEQVLRYRLQGLTTQQISRKMMISPAEVHRALDAILPKLEQHYRRRVISESLLICDKVIAKQRRLPILKSASVVIRGLCERLFWIGVNASTDPVQLTKDSSPEKSTDAYKRAFERTMNDNEFRAVARLRA